MLEIENSAFEKENDLRFVMKADKVETLIKWFLERKDREVTPGREVFEELVEEAQLLRETDLSSFEYEVAGYSTELAISNRTGLQGKPLTLRLLEIHDVSIKYPVVLNKLLQASLLDSPQLIFVTEEEIKAGVSNKGETIGTVANALLTPQSTIEYKRFTNNP